MVGYITPLIFLLFSSNIFSLTTFKTACEILKLPRDCHCQRTRGVPISSLNETRLRCRQLTEITTNYRWSIVPYDRLAFETPNDNLTLQRYVFADIRARTLRFDVQNLFLNDHTFDNAYIGQLAISHTDNYGRINFQLNGQIFYGTTITNLYIKSINFQTQISEVIFSNAKIYTFLIQSSKFYGFTNKNVIIKKDNGTNIKNEIQYDNFLEYDLMLTTSSPYQTSSQSSPLKIRRKKKKKISRQTSFESSDEYSSHLPEQTVTINITSINLPAFITIYTILSSINTTKLTENYFPNNLEYSQTDEIELSYNIINSIDAYAFRHLQFFEGRLILTYNQIKYIHPYAFSSLYSLNNLSLANNNIQNISSRHFQNLHQLYDLDLSFNQIEQLNNKTFQYLYNLRILSLNNNPLKFIHSEVFTNLTNLKEIHLQGVKLIHLIDQQYSNWIWNLANLHVTNLLNTNFDLGDVAFCLLTRSNKTSFHLPYQHSCSCNVHYLYGNPDIYQNLTYSTVKYQTNYLRLTPICIQNETHYQNESEQVQYLNTNEFILRGLEDKCDYRFTYLDCDAMTTTTTTTTTITTTAITTEMTTMLETSTEITSNSDTSMHTTTEIPIPRTTLWYFKYTKPPKRNNAKKLFTVLGTLAAITIGAIILVILWYRLKAIFKRQEKKKKNVEQQRNLNSPSNNNNNHSTAPRYASSDMLGSIHSTQLTGNKSQSQALIAPASSPPSTIYKNVDAVSNDPIQNFIDEENQQQNITTDIQATTQC